MSRYQKKVLLFPHGNIHRPSNVEIERGTEMIAASLKDGYPLVETGGYVILGTSNASMTLAVRMLDNGANLLLAGRGVDESLFGKSLAGKENDEPLFYDTAINGNTLPRLASFVESLGEGVEGLVVYADELLHDTVPDDPKAFSTLLLRFSKLLNVLAVKMPKNAGIVLVLPPEVDTHARVDLRSLILPLIAGAQVFARRSGARLRMNFLVPSPDSSIPWDEGEVADAACYLMVGSIYVGSIVYAHRGYLYPLA